MITSEPTMSGWAYTEPSTALLHDFLTALGDGELIETPLRAAVRSKVGQASCAAVGCAMPFTGQAVTVPDDVQPATVSASAATTSPGQPPRRLTRLSSATHDRSVNVCARPGLTTGFLCETEACLLCRSRPVRPPAGLPRPSSWPTGIR